MLIQYLFYCSLFIFCASNEDLNILSSTQTSSLEKYESYKDIIMIHLKIPQDTVFASFKFIAEETEKMSLIQFGCYPRNVSLYMKQGAPPVINPDGSPFPKSFKNITRSKLYNLEFLTDKKDHYVNITSPEPGFYYAVTFLSYSDPKYNKITQQGLAPSCYASLEASLFARKIDNPLIISDNDKIEVVSMTNESRYFKFFIPSSYDHSILNIRDINFAPYVEHLIVRVDVNKPPSQDNFQSEHFISSNTTSTSILIWTKPESWHYIELKFENYLEDDKEIPTNLTFTLRYYTNRLSEDSTDYDFLENKTYYNNSLSKVFHNKITDLTPYKQYDLVRKASSETFLFTYELKEELDSNVVVPLNMTNEHFSVLKFRVREGTDIGGTLQFIIAFKPRIKREGKKFTLEDEPENHVIIACIRKGVMEIPTWPDKCVSSDSVNPAQLVLNKTVDNSTILIPYPEVGTWYATFKLFCGDCQQCNCPLTCQSLYEECLMDCDQNCIISGTCEDCSSNCSANVTSQVGCEECDCDGPCLRNQSISCNSSLIFDIGSHPCVFGECSANGKCMYMVSDGVVFSTCICLNKYAGWDCSDGSRATPYYMVVLELLLLVFSNFMFLPVVYISFRRKYYIESITYFSLFLFSSFYHACDAGENVISYCIVKLDALQFGDFFCALLSIWVTLIAMADVSRLPTSICHMVGAIVLAFCTTINKTALWIFALPFITGLCIVGISWYLKYKKVRQRFAKRKYLMVHIPIGSALVATGLILYAFLQTEDNYKYLHSVWHMIMATALIIVLPKPDTFLPEVLI